jgi:hypothetical protein
MNSTQPPSGQGSSTEKSELLDSLILRLGPSSSFGSVSLCYWRYLGGGFSWASAFSSWPYSLLARR